MTSDIEIDSPISLAASCLKDWTSILFGPGTPSFFKTPEIYCEFLNDFLRLSIIHKLLIFSSEVSFPSDLRALAVSFIFKNLINVINSHLI